MIESISINNFQSHKATNLKLGSKVNSIQGNSDCGKSAVLRALHWLTFNPAGDYFVSDWARKGKSISASCEISVRCNSHEVTRRRSKDFNGYILDGETFEATRNSVPPRVASALGLGEVNIQRQFDPPFLLSMSPGDVSRYVNGLVNLERIDKWVTAVNGKARGMQQELDSLEAQRSEAEASVKALSWVPELEAISRRALETEGRMKESAGNIASLKSEIASYRDLSIRAASLPDVERVGLLLEEAGESRKAAESLSPSVLALRQEIESYNESVGRASKLEAFASLPGLAEKLSGIRKRIEDLSQYISSIRVSLQEFRNAKSKEVPEALFTACATLEKWGRVRSSMEATCVSIRSELGTYSHYRSYLSKSAGALAEAESELSSMVCPMCGRKGMHSHEEVK